MRLKKRKKLLKLAKLQMVVSVLIMFLAISGTWFVLERVIVDNNSIDPIDYSEYQGIMGLHNQVGSHISDLWVEWDQMKFEKYLLSIDMTKGEYDQLDEVEREVVFNEYANRDELMYNMFFVFNEISFLASLAKVIVFVIGTLLFVVSLLFGLQAHYKYEELK